MVVLKAKQSFLTMQYIFLSRRPRCTCTKPDTVPRTFWIVITTVRRIKKTWNNDHPETACHVHSSYDWLYKPLSLAILQRFLKYCWLTKFPLLLLYPKLSSLRNECSINLNLSDHVCAFAEKYDDRRLQNKERINVLFVII